MSGEAKEPINCELILNVLGADFFTRSKQANSHEANDLSLRLENDFTPSQ